MAKYRFLWMLLSFCSCAVHSLQNSVLILHYISIVLLQRNGQNIEVKIPNFCVVSIVENCQLVGGFAWVFFCF